MGTGNSVWERAVDLIGVAAARLLAKHGLVVVDRAALDRWRDEYRRDNDMLRAAAAAAMNAIGIVSIQVSLTSRDGMPHIIACAPAGRERDLMVMACEAIADAWEPPDGYQPRRRLVPGDVSQTGDDIEMEAVEGDPGNKKLAAMFRVYLAAMGMEPQGDIRVDAVVEDTGTPVTVFTIAARAVEKADDE
jgi:hypothetical protein